MKCIHIRSPLGTVSENNAYILC